MTKPRANFLNRVRGSVTGKATLLSVALLLVLTSVLGLSYTRTRTVNAAASNNLNFQMRLLTAAGAVVPDGNYNVEFKLYDSIASGGSAQGVCSLNSSTDDCYWLETRTGVNKVRVVNGYMTVNLGSVTAFGTSIPWSQQLYLTANIGGTGTPSWDGEMVDGSGNRMLITSVPFAFQAQALSLTNGAITNTLSFATPASSNKTITIPNASGTVAVSASGNIALNATTGDLTLTGTVGVGNGGTGLTTYAVGDLIYASGTSTLAKLADVATGSCLISGGVGVAPSWGACTSTSNTLQAAYGNGNTITSTDARDFSFTSANTTTDANFLINMATGSVGKFAVQNNGTDTFTATSSAVTIAATFGATGTTTINTTGTATTGIGNATGALTFTGSTGTSFVLGAVNVSATEFNLLDGRDTALVDTTDAVATAITGTGALNAGSITSGFGAIDTGADNITTTGTVAGGTVNASTGTIQTGGTNRISNTGALQNIASITGTGALTVNATAGDLNLGVTTSGNVILGNNALANTIQIGNTTGAVAQTVNVGNNATASSTTTTVIGSTIGSSTTTLQAGSGGLVINAATLKRTASGTTTFDLIDASNTTLALTNSGAGVANLTVDGAVTAATGLTVSAGGAAITGNSTIAGTLGSLTGLTSSGTITFSGLSTAGIVTNTAGGVLGTTTTVPVANGGTGAGTFTANGVLYGNGTSAIGATAAGTTGQCLIATTAAAPSWGSCAGTGSGSTLQAAYNNGNTITTTDARDFSFTSANTTTDANFLINIATGSVGKFAVQSNGTDVFGITASAISSTLGYTQTGSGANTFSGAASFTAASVGLAVTNNATIGGTLGVTGTVTGGTYNGQTISSAANFTGTLAVTSTSTFTGLLTANGGVTVNGVTTITSTADDATFTGFVTNDSGVLKYRTAAQVATDISAQTKSSTSNAAALSSGTWYRVATATGGTGRFGAKVILSNTGGSGTPNQVEFNVVKDWISGSLITLISQNSSPCFTDIRVVNSNVSPTASYIDVRSGGCSSNYVTVIPLESNFATVVANAFTTPAGGTEVTLSTLNIWNAYAGVSSTTSSDNLYRLTTTGIELAGGYTQTGSTANTLTGATSLTAAGTALSVTNDVLVSGKIGVGGATAYKVGVTVGANTNQGYYGTDGTQSVLLTPSNGNTGVASVGTISNTDFSIVTNAGTEIARFKTNGNVGIGDTTPAALLTVGNGDLFQVNSSGAIAAATGVTSSGTITFSGLSTAGIVTNTAGGVLGTTATVPVANGGTNLSSYTIGDLIYASGATTLAKLADVAAGSCLISGGVGVAPSWSSCAASSVTLQAAYNNGNTVTTTDARDVTFTLANTTTDSDFHVNIATSSTSEFAVQSNAVNVFGVTSSAISSTLGYTQTGSGANTFSGASSFTAASVGLAVTNNATIGGTLGVTGTVTGGTYNGQTISSAANFTGTIAVNTSVSTPSVLSTGGLTINANGTNTLSLDTTGAGAITLGTNATTITLGAGSATETLNVGNSSGNDTINIATNTGTDTVNILTGSGTNTLNVGPVAGTTSTNIYGNITATLQAGKQVLVTAGSTVPTVDQVAITNTGSTGVTTAGVNGFSIAYKGGAAAIESSAQRIDLQPGGTSGGTWNALRVIQNATGPASGVTSGGAKFEGPTTGGAGTYNAINIANIGATTTSGVVRGINITGTNSQTAGTVRGIQLNNLTAGTASEIGIDLGTGWDNLITYNNGASVIVNGSGQLNLAQVTGTLAVGNGGTGAGTFTANGVLYGNGTSALGVTAAGTTNQCLLATTGSAPTWGSCTAGGGVTTLAAIGSSPNANGGTISTNTLTLQPADATFGGVVSATTQAFAGDKTFNGAVGIGATAASATASLLITQSSTTPGLVVQNGTNPLIKVVGGTSIGKIQTITNGAVYLGSESSSNVSIITGNSPRLTIDTSGNAAFTGNISQSGATTLSTGTGTVSLNGNTTIANGSTLTAGGGSLSVLSNGTVGALRVALGTESNTGILFTGFLQNELTNYDLRGGTIATAVTGGATIVGASGAVRPSDYGSGSSVTLASAGTAQWQFTGVSIPVPSRALWIPYVQLRTGQTPSAVLVEYRRSDNVTWDTIINDTSPTFSAGLWVGPEAGYASFPITGVRVTLSFASTATAYIDEIGLNNRNTQFGSNNFASLAAANTFYGNINIANGSDLRTAGTTRLTAAGVLQNVTNADASTFFTGGSLTVARGGTGAGTFTANGVLYGNGTSALGVTAAGTTGQCLVATTSAAPSWGSCAGTGSGSTLQAAYNNGNTITTTDARDITFTLANTTTDSDFHVNIATSSTSEFAVQSNAVNVFGVTSSAISSTLGYTQTGSGANTFSGAASFTAASTGLAVTNNATIGGTLGVTGDIQAKSAAGTSSTTSAIFGATKWRLQQTAGDESNAGVIDYRNFDPTALSIVGAGTSGSTRLVRVFDYLGVGVAPSTSYVVNVGGTLNASGATTLGSTLAVTSNATIGGTLQVGDYYVERSVANTFTNGVANQKFDLYFNRFWGEMEITVTSGYNIQNASGAIKKNFFLGLNPSNSVYTNTARYSEASGSTPTNFAISDVTWDATNSRYRVQIVHRVSTGNSVQIDIKALATSATDLAEINGMTVGAVYTTDTTVFPTPVVSVTDDLIVSGGNLTVGVNDTLSGNLALYGSGTANHEGGQLDLYFAADYDTTYQSVALDAYDTSFRIHNGTNVWQQIDMATGAFTIPSAAGTALSLSGAATTAIDITNTGVTTDISLQNNASIDNNVSGTLALITSNIVFGSASTGINVSAAGVISDIDGASVTIGDNLVVGGTGNQQSTITVGAGNHGIELGRTDGVASTPFFDFHSGATAADYDARIIASGGNGAIDGGDLTVRAATVGLTGALNVSGYATVGGVLIVGGVGTFNNTLNVNGAYVQTQSTAAILTLNTTTETAYNEFKTQSNGTNKWSIGSYGDTNPSANDFYIFQYSNAADAAVNATRFAIQSSTGNVGIGDTSPAALLTVGSGDLFQVNSSGAIAAAAGITSSGTITFSGLSTAGIVTNTSGGVLGTTATVPVANGGTNLSSYAVGDLLYASGATTLAKLADVAVGSCLISGGVGVAPSWGACASGVTMQSAYDNGNTVTSTNARNVSYTLADTATDANFLINIATSSTSKFAVQSNAVDVFGVTSTAVNTTLGHVQTGAGANTFSGAITASSTYNTNTFTSTALTFGGATGTVSSAAASALTVDSGTTGALNLGTTASAKTIQIGATTGAINQNINIGNNATASSTNAVVIGNLLATSATTLQGGTGASAIKLTAGASGTITIGNQGAANTVVVGSGAAVAFASTVNIANSTGAAQTVSIGSTNGTSTTTIQGGSNNITLNTSTGNKVIIGSATSDANQVMLQVDSFSTLADTATCSTTTNQGAIYYNTNAGSNELRTCVNGTWQGMVTMEGLGLLLFGVVPESGTSPGDFWGITGLTNSPCKTTWTSSTSVTVAPCTAYSGGRKVVVASTVITGLNVASRWYHICLTGTNNQPAASAASATETGSLPTFSVTAPILCLADVSTSGSSVINGIYDVRTTTNTLKVYATINTAAAPGMIPVENSGNTYYWIQSGGAPNQADFGGVIVATSGSASTNTINAIFATTGPQYVKTTATRGVLSADNIVAVDTTFSGGKDGYAYNQTTAGGGQYPNGFLGKSRVGANFTCSASTNCQGSAGVDMHMGPY